MLPDIEPNETNVDYWNRVNEDNKLQLYCQSCCYHYPDECINVELLHPYDNLAEICADFIPKDMYKGKARTKCWIKRLEVDPNYKPLPDNMVFHPIYRPFTVCNSTEYFMIMTKHKIYDKLKGWVVVNE